MGKMRISETNVFVEPRKRLIEWIRQQLVGSPSLYETESASLVGVLPTERFPCGALYPISSGEGIDPAGEEDDGLQPLAEDETQEPAILRRYMPPSSLGFSFFIRGEEIRFQVLCRAARYFPVAGKRQEWNRIGLGAEGGGEEEFYNLTCPETDLRQSFPALSGHARIDIDWRQFADGWLVTVSLCNSNEVEDGSKAADFVIERSQKTLFEASLRCVIDAGEVGAYPAVDRSLLDEEEQEIELQYAQRRVYAVGHGCAAQWRFDHNQVNEVYADTMPVVEVAQMTADTGSSADNQVLSLAKLAKLDGQSLDEIDGLSTFVESYASWVDEQSCTLEDAASDDRSAGSRIVERMQIAVGRMREGIDLLKRDALIRLSFALANRAMLDQMRQNDRVHGRERDESAYRWRPFQLAFLLTTLESATNKDSEFRDTVDLIWFPTGGGKTEAYLGLIAIQIALRRLRHPDTGGGTAVLMRYTLRLLTRDQFIRAARLICALELIRRGCSDLGQEPITIGMWVGEATSPNTFRGAADLVRKARQSHSQPALVLQECPWCQTPFSVERDNYDSTNRHFHFLCRHEACDFGKQDPGRLPCNVVDEALYDQAPTMLVATVDKFARLAWEPRANVFFGGIQNLPPELIIQDELHLIAGALGSVAGLYEVAVDTVVQARGAYPKYIASTATIRMASEQVRRLYGREVAVFPPPGLSCDDSFFAKTVSLAERPGRMYVGYLAPLLNRQRCLAPLAAALLVAPTVLFEDEQNQEALMDAWWTQIVYHGSLRSVGNSHTAFVSDVQDFMKLLLLQHGSQQPRSAPELAQLTSLQNAQENAGIFSRLTRSRNEEGSLDAVLATNMISVGLDVARLGAMIVNGQPLTTAEYIQASSRVGRGDVPGIVFINYYRDQARSLSHYESFRPYHDAFYRFVEPTSVTPYTYQARLRALHAALVIAVRHAAYGMLGNESAGVFDPEEASVAKVIDLLKRRCHQSHPDDARELSDHVDSLVEEWHHEVQRCQQMRRKLEYQVRDGETGRDRLICNHADRIQGLWATLQSFRTVENSALLRTF